MMQAGRNPPALRQARGDCDMAGQRLAAGRIEEADDLHRRCLDGAGGDAALAAGALAGLATARKAEGRLDEAWDLYRQAMDKAGETDPALKARVLAGQGDVRRRQWRLDEAERIQREALALAEHLHGRNSPEAAFRLLILAQGIVLQGRYAEAEPLLKQAIGRGDGHFGADISVPAINTLTALYLSQGRASEALALAERGLAIAGTVPRDAAPLLAANQMNSLAVVLIGLGRLDEARARLDDAEAAWAAVPGASVAAPALASNKVEVDIGHGRLKDAGILLEKTTRAVERDEGPDSPALGPLALQAARLALLRGEPEEADAHSRRALRLAERDDGPNHPNVTTALGVLGRAVLERGKPADSLPFLRRAAGLLERQTSTPVTEPSAGIESQRSQGRAILLSLISALDRQAMAAPLQAAGLRAEVFDVLQNLRTGATARAVAAMALRFAAGNDNLARLVRARQDAAFLRQAMDSALGEAIGGKGAGETGELGQKIDLLERRIAELDAELKTRFPEYAELTRPAPVSLADAQALLAADEALIVHAVAADRVFLFVARADRAGLVSAPVGEAKLAALVKAFRDSFQVGDDGELPPFRAAAAHALYKALVAPADAWLDGVKTLLIVPDGAIQSVSFPALISAPPELRGPSSPERSLRGQPWLARRFAVATLPGVSSLRALRRLAGASTAPHPFLGIGDPLLDDHPPARVPAPAPPNRGLRQRRAADLPELYRGGAVDPARLRAQPSLPESAWELETIAATLGGRPEDLVLRERATERAVRRELPLADYRIIAFATHGLMAGELPGYVEPALLLTPPATTSTEEDGLLSAGKVARLDLDADWVVLSACNTAASDGTAGAEGLSGLAKAFFHAGARGLLVSHWYVPTESAARITTTLFSELAAHPGLSRAEAHRRAMLAVLNDPDSPDFAHPLFWAPFTVVGGN